MQKANGYTRKQAGVVYRAVKEGKIALEKATISELYDLAEDFGIDWNGSANRRYQDVKLAVAAIFAKDYEKAQMHMDSFAGLIIADNEGNVLYVCENGGR